MDDKNIILNLGGVLALARLLDYSPQRVFNWLERGIPAREKIKRPDLFLKQIKIEKKM